MPRIKKTENALLVHSLLILVAAFSVFLTGCNFASHSYNYGKLLNPGESMITLAGGGRDFHQVWSGFDPDSADTALTHFATFVCNYRLGVLDARPLGEGLEIGLHLEGPVQLHSFFGVPLLEFDLRMGFRGFVLGNGLYHHNAGIGWTVGPWIDNGWYVEYAAGWELERIIPYASLRGIIAATDISESGSDIFDDDFFVSHDRSAHARLAVGAALKIRRLPIVPDLLAPEISIIGPGYSIVKEIGVTWHIGLRWLNGI